MAKKTGKADPQERARRVLVKAQLKLEMAQEKHAQERARGQQEVEKARLRAQKWLAKAAQRVERRAQAVAQAEAALATAGSVPRDTAPDGRSGSGTPKTAAEPSGSPEAAVDRVEEVETVHADRQAPSPVTIPDGIPSMQGAVEQSPQAVPDPAEPPGGVGPGAG